MCFIKYFKTKEKAVEAKNNPKIAKRDIPVWKQLISLNPDEKVGFSPYYSFPYFKGFHYYITDRRKFGIYVEATGYSRDYKLVINKGLHSYSSNNRYKINLVKMYIPKGALYYTDGEEYVSSQLVWY